MEKETRSKNRPIHTVATSFTAIQSKNILICFKLYMLIENELQGTQTFYFSVSFKYTFPVYICQ